MTESVGIHTPFPILPGGGESYLLTLASVISDAGLPVTLYSNVPFSNLRLHQVSRDLIGRRNLTEITLGNPSKSYVHDLWILMDNHLRPSFRPPDISPLVYHCQFPFPRESKFGIKKKSLRAKRISTVVFNSDYSKKHFEKQAGEMYRDSTFRVISPPIQMERQALHKDSIDNIDTKTVQIVSVGRFANGGHDKNQIQMIRAVEHISTIQPNLNFRLVLHGGLDQARFGSHFGHINDLAKLAELWHPNIEMELKPNSPRNELIQDLAASQVYWHAAGLGRDELLHPETFEHFGIAPLEAMMMRCVPFVYRVGGPSSYVKHGVNGYVYGSIYELASQMIRYLDSNRATKLSIAESAENTAMKYSEDSFGREWMTTITSLIS